MAYLASLSIIKAKIKLTDSQAQDSVLNEMIQGVSSLIESYCDREFEHKRRIQYFDSYNGSIFYTNSWPITNVQLVQERTNLDNAVPGDSQPVGDAVDITTLSNLSSQPAGTWENLNSFLVKKNTGEVIVSGVFRGLQNIRLVYEGGYVINWDDAAVHTLPKDLSMVAEKIVVKLFKRREQEGYRSITFDQSTITLDAVIDTFDRKVMMNYKKMVV